MSIKNKLLGIIILFGFSFIIIILFIFFSINLILDLKKVESKSSSVLVKWGYLQASNKAVLVSRDPLEVLQKRNQEAIKDFDKIFNEFQNNQNKIFINKEIKTKIISSNKVWLLLKKSLDESQRSLNEIVNLIKTGVFYNNLDNKSLLQICYSEKDNLKINNEKNELANLLVLANKLLNTDSNIDYSANIFSKLLNDINDRLSKFAEQFVALTVIIVAALSILIFLFSFLVMLIFSKRLSNKIIKVEEVMNKVAEKDFTANIYFDGNDELSKLSNNINKTVDILRKFFEDIKKSNVELQQFAYIASHDLQEPLRKITVFGNRLKEKYHSFLDEQGKDYLERIQNASARMQTLINDLLNYSRITTKAKPFIMVDFSQMVNEVLSDLEIQIEKSGGSVELDHLPIINADPTQMRQLFQNLIVNALKFSKKGIPPVVKIYTLKETPKGFCSIAVEDNGIGISKKDHEIIFGVFQRLHSRNEYEGSGIGLAVCKKIVERHGGTIMIESFPGEGTKFIVNLLIKK